MFSFEGWRLLLLLGRPLWRARDKQIAIFDQKKLKIFFSCIFFHSGFGHHSKPWIWIGSGSVSGFTGNAGSVSWSTTLILLCVCSLSDRDPDRKLWSCWLYMLKNADLWSCLFLGLTIFYSSGFFCRDPDQYPDQMRIVSVLYSISMGKDDDVCVWCAGGT